MKKVSIAFIKVIRNVLCSLTIGLTIPVLALADNVRPVYLEIEERSSGKIQVVWKVPLGQGLPDDLRPSFPERFKVVPPKKNVQTSSAHIEIWEMIAGGGGLAGAQIGINGLVQTTTEALVRIRLSDGSIHRVVLRPTRAVTTIPNARSAEVKQ